MTIKQTSLKTYFEIQREGLTGEQANKILDYIKKYPGQTRNEISTTIPIKINAVCGRVKELLDLKLIEERQQREDFYTKRLSYCLYVKEA